MPEIKPSIRLSQTYFEQEDVVALAKDLIGKELFTCFNGQLSSGIITETEAYAGITDKASHAFGGRRTARTETMYAPGGTAYVYLCYGIHHLFNVVTNHENIPHAILVRAVFPFKGVETILKRRNQSGITKTTSGGPGTVSAALGIRTLHNGIQVGLHSELGIIDHGAVIPEEWIQVGKRIGVEYAKEDANLPYRFWLNWEDSKKVKDMLS